MLTVAPAMAGYTREDRKALARWLAWHLSAARKQARGVNADGAARGVQANSVTGAPAIRPMAVSSRTITRLEEMANRERVGREVAYPASPETQIDAMLEWVRQYLGYGPETCRLQPCAYCPVLPKEPVSRGVRLRKQRG